MDDVAGLVDRYHDDLFRLALALTDDFGVAQDAVQHAFRQLVDHRSRDLEITEPSRWLRAVAVNVLRRRFARSKETPLDPAILQEMIESRGSHLDAPEETGIIGLVRSALNGLPTDTRRAFLLHYSGLSDAEVAKSLEIPLGTAKWRIRVAKKVLAVTIEDEK